MPEEATQGSSSRRKLSVTCDFPGCDKTYSRVEHLNRHKLSHSKVKPHKCSICGKSFARNDVLTRHQRQHTRDANKAPSATEASPQDSRTESATPVNGMDDNADAYGNDMQSFPGASVHDLQVQGPPPRLSDLVGMHGQDRDDSYVRQRDPHHELQHVQSQGNELLEATDLPLHHPFFPTEPATPVADAPDTFAPNLSQHLPSSSLLQTFAHRPVNPLPMPTPAFREVMATLSTMDSEPKRMDGSYGGPPSPIWLAGLHTRAPSPIINDREDLRWPMQWSSDYMSNLYAAEVSMLEQEYVPQVYFRIPLPVEVPQLQELSRIAILELLHFSALPSDAYHQLYAKLARVHLSVLNLYLRLYFEHVNVYIPLIHLPTFEPRNTSTFLLATILAVGAQLSNVPGSAGLSSALGEAIQFAVQNEMRTDESLYGDIKLWQTLIVWDYLAYSGTQRLQDKSELSRSAVKLALHRLGYLHGYTRSSLQARMDRAQDLETTWKWWKTWETDKRTTFVAFVQEADRLMDGDSSLIILPKHLDIPLPCPEAAWNAPTPNAWASVMAKSTLSNHDNLRAYQILDYDNVPPTLVMAARQSPLTCIVLVHCLGAAIWNVRQAGDFSRQALAIILADIRKPLSMLGGGPNDFNILIPDIPHPCWRTYGALYHQTQIVLRIDPNLVLGMIEGSHSAMKAAKIRLIDWLGKRPQTTRELLLHAGQCLRFIRAGGPDSPAHVKAFMLSGLVIYAFVCMVGLQADESPAESAGSTIALDAEEVSDQEIDWTRSQSCMATFGDILLWETRPAKSAILAWIMGIMGSRNRWGIGVRLARSVQRMIDEDQVG